MRLKRVLGSYSEGRPGPTLICIAGLHGNEWAGVHATDLLVKMLEVEPITNPEFIFHGRIIFLLGNLSALRENIRFIDLDLNRIWHRNTCFDATPNNAEEKERNLLYRAIEKEISRADTNHPIAILDLHTTTATGGIFSLPADDPVSVDLAMEMHAPVITGLVNSLDGTLLRYFLDKYAGRNIRGVVFEGGQHEDPLSVNRCIAAVINCMRTIGCVSAKHIVNRHDELLVTYAKGLPKIATFRYVHRLTPDDDFSMKPGYENFDAVNRGEVVASDKSGDIAIKEDGLIIMPLYQTKGEDGFFVVQQVEL